jgi:putative ABC transport system permease protein
MRRPSRVTAWLLRLALSRHRADAVIGDISEELARHEKRPWPRLWFEARALMYLATAWRLSGPASLRSARHVVRDSIRAIQSAPGMSAFIVLILTVGITAATVTFSVVDTVVLRPLPFPQSDELVVLSSATSVSNLRAASVPEYLRWRQGNDALSALAAYRGTFDTVTFGTDSEAIQSARTTANLFDVLRTPPLAGQLFTPDHEIAGRDRVAVIGLGLAQRRFGSAASALGQRLALRDGPVTILGVMPGGFSYPLTYDKPVELWRPLVIRDDERQPQGGLSRDLQLVGRLRPGASPLQALAQLEAATQDLRQAFPHSYRDWTSRIVSLYESLVGNVRGWMLLVLWAVGLVMLVACANVANLLLMRSTVRARELAVRTSLGATRRQLVAGLLTEGLLLSLSAAGLAVLLASWGVGVAKAALPLGIPRAEGISLDLRILGTAIAMAVMTGLVFGAVPAWQASRADVVGLLKDAGSNITSSRRHWRAAFVILEVAFVAVLLVATALFVSSFIKVTRAPLGFDRADLMTTDSFKPSPQIGIEVADVLRQIPGVASVAIMAGGSPPLIMRGFGGGASGTNIRRADAPSTSEVLAADMRRVSPDYFKTAGIAFIRGSVFADADSSSVVIDDVAAQKLFAESAALGATIRIQGMTRDFTIVGVVANVHVNGPEEPSGAQVYFPLLSKTGNVQFLIRTSGPATPVVPAVQAALGGMVAPGGQPAQVLVVQEAFRRITADRRFSAGLMSIFGLLALLIGAAGIYSVMASLVALQMREIGLRLALGATAARIRREVIDQAGRYLLTGLALGLPIAWWVSRAFASLLFRVEPSDGFVYAAVAITLVVVGIAAALAPAWRAGRVDPLVTLKS